MTWGQKGGGELKLNVEYLNVENIERGKRSIWSKGRWQRKAEIPEIPEACLFVTVKPTQTTPSLLFQHRRHPVRTLFPWCRCAGELGPWNVSYPRLHNGSEGYQDMTSNVDMCKLDSDARHNILEWWTYDIS
jgi:hypothetical protein